MNSFFILDYSSIYVDNFSNTLGIKNIITLEHILKHILVILIQKNITLLLT